MPRRYYTLTVLGSALSWLLVGLHLPVVHEVTHHGARPHWGVLILIAIFSVSAIRGTWILLRAHTPRSD
ncbi:MAG TPA: hypothetical protein VGE02_04950 [Gemmatimonadales bacterium]